VVALAAEVLTPILAERGGDGAQAHPGHLPERFGLFTLIMLGEAVAGLMAGMKAQTTWTSAAAVAAVLGLAMTFLLWWLYFDRLRAAAPWAGKSPSLGRLALWLLAHLPLCLGIVVVAVGIRRTIGAGGDMSELAERGWVFGGGIAAVAVALLVIRAVEWDGHHSPQVVEPVTANETPLP